VRYLTLQEEATESFAESALTSAEAVALLHCDQRFEVGFPNPGNPLYTVRPKGYVGYFPVSPDLAARVGPKVAISAVLAMLDQVYALNMKAYLDGTYAATGLDGLIHSLAAVLAERILDRCRRGLYGAYVRREEALGAVRGRILVRETVTRHFAEPLVECAYDEFSRDVLENQSLLWTLYVISRARLPEHLVLPIARAFRALRGEAALTPLTARDLRRVRYNRLNADYADLHAICRMFLDHLSPGFEAGQQTSIPFKLYMPTLFQDFVASWLKGRLPAHLELSAQVEEASGGDLEIRLKPDMVISDRATKRPVLLVDAKYKFSGKPAQSDIFQAVTYATHWRVPEVLLLYPEAGQGGTAIIGGITVRTAAFDLSQPPATWGLDCLASLGTMNAA